MFCQSFESLRLPWLLGNQRTHGLTIAATLYGELKLPFFRNDELYFKISHISGCRLSIRLF